MQSGGSASASPAPIFLYQPGWLNQLAPAGLQTRSTIDLRSGSQGRSSRLRCGAESVPGAI